MPSTSLYARRTAALGPLVALILIAWLFGLYWITAVEPLSCGAAGPVLSGCTNAEVRNSQALMYVYWAMALGGPMLALGVWTFLSPGSHQFRAAYTVVAVWLFIAAPWLLNVAAGFLTGEIVLAGLLPEWGMLRMSFVLGVVCRLILIVSAPFVLSILLLRRGHWIYASAWIAVTVTVVAVIKAVLS